MGPETPVFLVAGFFGGISLQTLLEEENIETVVLMQENPMVILRWKAWVKFVGLHQ